MDATFTLTKTTNIEEYIYIGGSNRTYNNYKFNIQLTTSNSADYNYVPHEEQEYELNLGVENLAINTNTSKTINGVTFTIQEDKSIVANGTATADTYYVLRNDLSFKAGETYTLSGVKGGSLSTYYIYCYNIGDLVDGSKTTTLSQDWANRQLGIVIKNGATVNNVKFAIQLERGNKVSQYNPYNQEPLEVCEIGDYEDEFVIPTNSKNMFNKNTITSGYRLLYNGDLFEDALYFTSDYIDVEASTKYYINIQPTASKRIIEFNSNKENIKENYNITTLQTQSNTKYIRFCALLTELNTTMVNQGDSALPYEPYNDGKWYLKKNIGKVVLDGSETIRMAGVRAYYVPELKPLGSLLAKTLSDRFIDYASYAEMLNHENSIYNNGTNIYFYNSLLTTAQNWTDLFTNKPSTFYYPLETSQYIPLSDTLQQQLNNIHDKVLAYQDQTNISQVNNDLPFTLKLSAIRDMSNIFELIENN